MTRVPKPPYSTILILAVLAFPAAAQGNDHCAGAITFGPGVTTGSNVGATTGPDPLPAFCGLPGDDVWFVFVAPCNGPWAVSTCSATTNFDTILTLWDGSGGCGALLPILCNDDFCGPPFSPLNSYVTFQSVAGATYYISVGGHFGAQGTFELSLEPIATELSFFSSGPGTIGYQIDGGPPNGTTFTAITLASVFFPYGWFNGIDITLDDLVGQWQLGYPFVATPGGVCGDVTMGPFSGLPSGIVLYGVTVGIPDGQAFPFPRYTSAPAFGFIP